MLEDALLDLSNRGDIVLDPFLGSGSTLIAAENTGRICRGVELDPLYVDVIIRRYEAASGEAAILVETGETFHDLTQHRPRDRTERNAEGEDGLNSDGSEPTGPLDSGGSDASGSKYPSH
jgi:antitoxin (DNA-binding transcriptional repressor) of toxin-antitoxin stability system